MEKERGNCVSMKVCVCLCLRWEEEWEWGTMNWEKRAKGSKRARAR